VVAEMIEFVFAARNRVPRVHGASMPITNRSGIEEEATPAASLKSLKEAWLSDP